MSAWAITDYKVQKLAYASEAVTLDLHRQNMNPEANSSHKIYCSCYVHCQECGGGQLPSRPCFPSPGDGKGNIHTAKTPCPLCLPCNIRRLQSSEISSRSFPVSTRKNCKLDKNLFHVLALGDIPRALPGVPLSSCTTSFTPFRRFY